MLSVGGSTHKHISSGPNSEASTIVWPAAGWSLRVGSSTYRQISSGPKPLRLCSPPQAEIFEELLASEARFCTFVTPRNTFFWSDSTLPTFKNSQKFPACGGAFRPEEMPQKVLPTLNPGDTPPPREGVSVKLYTLRRTSGSHNLQVGTPMTGVPRCLACCSPLVSVIEISN